MERETETEIEIEIEISIIAHPLKDFRDDKRQTTKTKLTEEEQAEIRKHNKKMTAAKKRRIRVYRRKAAANLPLFSTSKK